MEFDSEVFSPAVSKMGIMKNGDVNVVLNNVVNDIREPTVV